LEFSEKYAREDDGRTRRGEKIALLAAIPRARAAPRCT
jgi:hypothetical protein